MGMQEMNVFENGLAFYGMFKLMEYPPKIETYLQGYFSDIFTDPWEDWLDIRRAFEAFGTEKMQSNASFSKHEDQGDGSKGQFMFNFYNDGVLVQIFEICKKLGILKDADDVEITYKCPPTPKEIENFNKWRALASMYEKLKDVQTTMILSAFAIAPNLGSIESIIRSPEQMKLYSSYLTQTTESTSEEFGGSTDTSILYKVPHSATNFIHSSMVTDLTTDWWAKLIVSQSKMGSYNYVDAPLYTFTQDDIDNEFFNIPGCDPNTIVNTEYMILLPTDSTADISVELKTCYGLTFGESLLFDCEICEYRMEDIAGEGRCGRPILLSPHTIDFSIGNQINLGSPPPPILGYRVKIRYKTGSVS